MSSVQSVRPDVLLRSEETDGHMSVTEIEVPARSAGPPLHTHDFDALGAPRRRAGGSRAAAVVAAADPRGHGGRTADRCAGVSSGGLSGEFGSQRPTSGAAPRSAAADSRGR
jgi:hypothetical protein